MHLEHPRPSEGKRSVFNGRVTNGDALAHPPISGTGWQKIRGMRVGGMSCPNGHGAVLPLSPEPCRAKMRPRGAYEIF